MLENIRLSFRGIWSHKLRSILTMLGIIIGIASIIAIVSTIQGTNEQIKQNLVGSGTNTVTVTLYKDGWNYEFDYEGRADILPLSDDLKSRIAEIESVDRVSFVHMRDYASDVMSCGQELSCSLLGVDDAYFNTAGYQVMRGRGFSARELSAKAGRVCLLDRIAVAGSFGGEDPIGGTVEIRGIPFTVIGVVKESSTFEPTINTMNDYYTYAGDKTGRVFVPVNAWPLLFGYDEPETVVVRAVSTDAMTDAGRRTANLINDTLGLKNDENGALQTIIMGCYGIGVSRIIAGCAETSHDDSGIIWPVALAPYEVCVCPVKATDEAAMAAAEKIVADLEAAGVDAILDDRDERPGVKFKDADLVGFPVRVTIGKSLADGKVEVKWRWDADSSLVAVDEVAKTLTAQLEDERKTNARFYAAKKNGK